MKVRLAGHEVPGGQHCAPDRPQDCAGPDPAHHPPEIRYSVKCDNLLYMKMKYLSFLFVAKNGYKIFVSSFPWRLQAKGS